jgi:hypothetical protein
MRHGKGGMSDHVTGASPSDAPSKDPRPPSFAIDQINLSLAPFARDGNRNHRAYCIVESLPFLVNSAASYIAGFLLAMPVYESDSTRCTT